MITILETFFFFFFLIKGTPNTRAVLNLNLNLINLWKERGQGCYLIGEGFQLGTLCSVQRDMILKSNIALES